MNIVTKIEEWQIIRKQLSDKTIGLIPTMGNLHAGHLSLCKRSQFENDITVISVFVNPTQFNQPEDFELYPRTLEADIAFLSPYNFDFLLYPDPAEMYPDNYHIQLSEMELSRELEGACRPGHFSGMLTIVLKLLNLARPTRAYFGEKDYQQLLLVKKMAAALFLPVEIVGCETVRAHDHLALSSRNSRLAPDQRKKAANFPRLLQSSLSLEAISEELISLGFKVDYITEKWHRRLGAVWLDKIRLIDNIPIK